MVLSDTTKHILIVDDYPDIAAVTATLLEESCPIPITTEICFNGAEAVTLATACRPAVVILDIDMPVMNGIDAANAIRAHLTQSRPCFIAMTGNPARFAALDVRLAFDHVLGKPCDFDELVALVVNA